LKNNVVRIAIDGMGGDRAPEEIVAGALRAAQSPGCRVLLVGDEHRLVPLLKRGRHADTVEVVHADQIVAMDEPPSAAARRGAVTSMGKTIDLVREGAADAAFSAGNSGAMMALATIRLRPLPGIARPAIATGWPVRGGIMLLIDAGANVDCKPEWLAQFAIMGSAYSHAVLGVESPRVGLLNVGEEESKGNALTEATFPLLAAAPVNFIGNVEGRDLLAGTADVVVCDGFVGNVALKLAESASEYFFGALREASTSTRRSRIGAALLRPALRKIRKQLDYREHGGAPLLGVRGICLIGHGRTDALAVESACRGAMIAVRRDLVGAITRVIHPPSTAEFAHADPTI
jgi:phosphate acyltransferase